MPPGISEDPFVLRKEMSEGVLVFLGPPTISSRKTTTQLRKAHQNVITLIGVLLELLGIEYVALQRSPILTLTRVRLRLVGRSIMDETRCH